MSPTWSTRHWRRQPTRAWRPDLRPVAAESDGPPTASSPARLGAVGEVTGWAFDSAGRIIPTGTNERLTSVPREVPPSRLVVGVAQGTGKVLPIHAALRGRIINGLITNETTARSLLDIG